MSNPDLKLMNLVMDLMRMVHKLQVQVNEMSGGQFDVDAIGFEVDDDSEDFDEDDPEYQNRSEVSPGQALEAFMAEDRNWKYDSTGFGGNFES